MKKLRRAFVIVVIFLLFFACNSNVSDEFYSFPNRKFEEIVCIGDQIVSLNFENPSIESNFFEKLSVPFAFDGFIGRGVTGYIYYNYEGNLTEFGVLKDDFSEFEILYSHNARINPIQVKDATLFFQDENFIYEFSVEEQEIISSFQNEAKIKSIEKLAGGYVVLANNNSYVSNTLYFLDEQYSMNLISEKVYSFILDKQRIIFVKTDNEIMEYDLESGNTESIFQVDTGLVDLIHVSDSYLFMVAHGNDMANKPVKRIYRLDLSTGQIEIIVQFTNFHCRSYYIEE
jgi:hypothetical protein